MWSLPKEISLSVQNEFSITSIRDVFISEIFECLVV